jgi:hypothetical protein
MKLHHNGLAMLCFIAACIGSASAQQFDGLGVGSPESQGRPGEIYFYRGVAAIRHKDYPFAVQMYQVAASWAYKDAEYNLAVIYLHGEGVPVDRPRAMAWIALAAERGDKRYVDARELIYADLSADEFAHANEIYRELKPDYGDDTALHRAKAKWVETRDAATGSHVGFVGNLEVGTDSPTGSHNIVPVPKANERNSPKGTGMPGGAVKAKPDGFATSAFGFTNGNQVDGTIAYRELQATDNPYDPRLQQGTATVGPLQPIDAKTKKDAPKDDAPANDEKSKN